ncbi:uncharacterized protein [Apostichopus japonicus]|uniref:uncharacterized protein isoform X3 n=1 Tax=Stichopus japonicus TaxID=307972 RepID=UPI003AB52A75
MANKGRLVCWSAALLLLQVTVCSAQTTITCDTEYTTKTLSLKSQNPYMNGENCAFYINYAGGLRTTLDFTAFDLEYKSDYLYIGQGGPDDVSVENADFLFSGVLGNDPTVPDDDVVIESGKVWFLFQTDQDVVSSGFTFDYSVAEFCESPEEYTDEMGEITSPMYPSMYNSGYNCQSDITVSSDAQILLQFHDVDIAEGDMVMVSDAMNSLMNISGNNLPKDYLSESNHLTITFMSDSTNSTGRGFRLTYKQVRIVVPQAKGPVADYTFDKPIGFKLSSMNHPQNYHDNSLYMFTVTSATAMMNIHVFDLNLEEVYDMMMIGSGSDFGENVLFTFQENPTKDPGVVTVGESTAWVWFKTDYNETARGFNLWFDPIDAEDNKAAPPDFGTDPIELCGTNLVVKNPVNISDPEYPGYNNNTICNWQITNKDRGERLKLRFWDFETEDIHDTLEVGIGTDSTVWYSLYQLYSGSAYPSQLIVPSDSLWIKFQTDYSITSRGFSLQIEQAADPSCLQTIMLDSETPNITISSPGYGSQGYSADTYCQWIIMAPAGSRLGVRFGETFDTEDNYDFVEIGSGDKPGYFHTREKVYSGSMAEDFLANYDSMWVTFTSDDANHGQGFEMTVNIETSCGVVTLHDEAGVITSPWYPEMYPNEADCFWIIQTEGRFNIRLTFDQFDLEAGHDKLYVGGVEPDTDGISDFLVMTGNTSQELTSNYNGLNLRFTSDGSNRRGGFQITYEQVYECPDGWEFGLDGETCYKFVTEPKSWLSARYECDNYDEGDLVIITSQAELDYVSQRMNMTGSNDIFWVGAYDAAVEGSFEWGDCSSSVTFLRNEFNSPFGFPADEEKDCAYYDPVNQYFDDSECSIMFPFVCEITQLDDLDIYPRNLEGTAESTRSVSLTWDVSPVNCDLEGYRIRYNTSETDYEYVLVSGANSDSLEISGLSPETYYNFEMTLVTYTYGNYSFRTAKSVIVRTNLLPVCPDGYFIGYDDGCYKLGMTPMSWKNARLDCASEIDSDLVNIETADENELLRGLLGDSDSYWINLQDEMTPDEFQWTTFCIGPPFENWEQGSPATGEVGLSKGCVELDGASGEWRDVDCSMMRMYVCEIRPRSDDIRDLSPTDIAAQPRSYDTAFAGWSVQDRLCDVIGYNIIGTYNVSNVITDQTNFVPGAESTNGFVYGLPGQTRITITVGAESYTFGGLPGAEDEFVEITTLPVPLCPPFYERGFENGCYRFVRNTTSWFDARKNCKEIEHGDLAVIDSQEELDFVLDETNGGDWWIGMSDLAIEDYFRWVTCDDVDGWAATNWGDGEPNNLDDVQHCVHMVAGKWNDWKCERPVNYICEINEKEFDSSDANPSNIQSVPVSLTSLNVSWDISENNCDLTGYRLWVNGTTLASPRVERIDGAQTTSYELKDLLPDTEYQLRMAAASGNIVQPFTLPEVHVRTANESSGLCPQDYARLYMNTCYKLGFDAMSWDNARADCQSSPGGELMVINDDDEYDFIVGAAGDIEWWMGLYDKGQEGAWRWVDCSDKDNSDWFPGEPDDYGKQDCGYLQEGFFYDWQCEAAFPYVCEVMDKGFELEDVSPSDVAFDAVSGTNIRASWTVSPYDCEVTGYKIRYRPTASVGEYQVEEVVGGATSEFVIGGLRSSTRYNLAVAAVTTSGDLEYAGGDNVQTLDFDGLGCVEPANVTEMYGVVESPFFPDNYPSGLDCTWVFRYPEGYRLQLEFLSWLLTDSADYLEILELSPEQSNRPAKTIPGSITTPGLYQSYGNIVSVSFVTDGTVQSQGFQIAYEAIDEGLPEDKNCYADVTIKANSIVTIQSEGYSKGYSDFLDCVWVVRSSGTGGVTLNFVDVDFDLGGGDFLEVGTGATVNRDSLVKQYTEMTDESIDLASETIWISFRTDGGLSGRGFSLFAQDYTAVSPKSIKDSAIGGDEFEALADCGETVVVPMTEREEVTSPGYNTGGYNNSEDCTWILDSSPGQRFRVTFFDFDTELGYDFVEVGYGEDPSDRTTLLLRASGSSLPDPFMVPDDGGWVRFTSDSSETENGFGFYVGVDTGCQITHKLPLGGSYTFQTPNYPNNYDFDEFCWWEINGEHTQNLRIEVEDFSTEEGFDVAEIGYGGVPLLTSRLLATSGTMSGSMSINYFRAWVTFTSDSSVQSKGFRMTVYDDNCLDQTYNDAYGVITSPGFGNMYYNNMDCQWRITVSVGLNIRLKFSAFDLENGRDILYVLGTMQAPLEQWPLTGSEIPADLFSAANTLTLNFRSDFTVTGAGFNLTYEEIYYCEDGFVAGTGHDGISCYYLGTTPKSWTDARAHCRSFPNSDLIIIENAIENRFITGVSGGEDWWIGFYDAQTEGSFYWSDCVTPSGGFAAYNWNLTQPDNANGNEDCAVLLGVKEPGYYADFPCTREVKYICEKLKEGKSFYEPSIGNPTEVKGKGTTETSIRVEWTPASSADNCDQIGYAIHYTDEDGNMMTATVDGITTSVADISGLAVNAFYTVSVVANTFSTGMGTTEDTISVKTLSPAEQYCPTGYIEGPDFTCFYLALASEAANWQEARRSCERTPMGDLAVVETQEELSFIQSQPGFNGVPFWIGLNDLAVENDFQWSDCQDILPWQRLNFAPGEPDDTDESQNCVAINGNGRFIDTQCSGVWQYVCKVVEKDYLFEDQFPTSFRVEAVSALALRATWVASEYNCDLLGYKVRYNDGIGGSGEVVVDDPNSGTVLIEGLSAGTNYAVGIVPYNTIQDFPMYGETNIYTLPLSSLCPDDYIVGYDYGCYQFNSEHMTWEAARAHCRQAVDGDLAIIDEEAEMNFLLENQLLEQYDWWIGMTDRASEGNFYWTDCSMLSNYAESRWAAGQPSDVDGSDNCVQLSDNGNYNDRDCESSFPYICEINTSNYEPEEVVPRLFLGSAVSHVAIRLSWIPSQYTCEVTGYRVYYGEIGAEVWEAVEVPGGDSDGVTIFGLEVSTTYGFQLRTVTLVEGERPEFDEVTVTTLEAPECPPMYERGTDDNCYYFARNTTSWEQARGFCQGVEDGDLAIIDNQVTLDYILSKTMGGDWWIGAYDQATEGRWRWVDCMDFNDFSTSNWASGQPSGNAGEDCGQLLPNGQFNDWPCERPVQYICQIVFKEFEREEASPTNLAAAVASYTSVEVTWDPSPYNCDVTGYQVWVSDNSTAPLEYMVEGGGSSMYEVMDLLPEMTYSFSVAAVTAGGVLPYLMPPVMATLPDETADLCPQGYRKQYNNGCYKIGTTMLSWYDARTDCQSTPNSDLIVINDADEDAYWRSVGFGADWWIGLYDIGTEGDFQWIDCTRPTSFDNWGPEQPDDYNGDEDCVLIASDWSWNDWVCSDRVMYLCEINENAAVDPSDANPTFFSVSAQSYSSARISWQLGSKICDVLGYNIRYRVVGSLLWTETFVAGGDTSEYILENLRPATSYDIAVSARSWTSGDLDYLTSKQVVLPSYNEPGCDGNPETIDHGIGNVSSPLSPGQYPPNVDCVYIFDFDEGSRIEFQFFLWVLTDSNDFVEITELNPEFADVPPKILTGFATPKVYLSYGNRIQVRFTSDDASETIGFIILYRPVELGFPESKCQADYTTKANAPALQIQSEGYPSVYPPYEDCTWILRAGNQGNKLALNIYDISLEEHSDWVDIGIGTDPTDMDSRLYRYDGSEPKEDVIYSGSATMWIRFRSDSSQSGRGVSFGVLEWSGEPMPTKQPAVVSKDVVIQAVCNGSTINVPSGGGSVVITSSDYPGNYGNNEICTWQLVGNPGRRYKVVFDNFDTEEGYDFVEVRTSTALTALGVEWPLLMASGSAVPGDVVINNRYGSITFTSDQSGTASGFQIRIQEDVGCEAVLNVPAGGSTSFSTAGYPNTNYLNNEFCFWTIQGEEGVNLRGMVNGNQLEQGYDYVDMGTGDGPSDLTTRLLKSFDLPQESYSFGTDTAWVVFTSDGTVRDDGLEMTFYDDSCQDQSMSGEMGSIFSPGFGGDYFNFLSCRWTINVADPYVVRLAFQSFDLETDRDFLIVTGVIDSPLTSLPLTGSAVPDDILSQGNTITMLFETDGSTVGSGFEITWMQDYNCPEGYSEGVGSYGPSCYKFGMTPMTWQSARQDCRSTPNADLVIIENAIENRFIRDLSGGVDWWIGIYDGALEGLFYHTDCQSNLRKYGTSLNWNLTQPDDANDNEDCVALLGDNEPGYYADFNCAIPKNYVCEVQPAGVYDASASLPKNVEGEGTSTSSIRIRWKQADLNDCDIVGYTAFYTGSGPTMSQTVEGADATHVDIEGLMPSTTYTVSIWPKTFSFGVIPNEEDLMVSTLSVTDQYCPDGYVEGPAYSCYRLSSASLSWQDARDACRVEAPDGELAVVENQEQVDFLLALTGGTEDYWIGLNDHATEGTFRWTDCTTVSLLVDVWQARNWAAGEPSGPLSLTEQDCGTFTTEGQWADEVCNLRKKYICEIVPKVYSLEDQYPSNFNFMITSAISAQAMWVPSLRYICDILGYKIFLSDGLNEDLVTDRVGGSTVLAQVNDLRPDTNYAVSWAPYNVYGDLPRIWEPVNYDTPSAETLCDDGYIVGYNYGCYKFVSDVSLSWNDARAECQMKQDSDLAVIDDADELQFIVDAGLATGFDWWVGLSDRVTEGEYYWTDCSMASNFTLANWDAQQPSDTTGSENCIVLQDNGKINDRDCSRSFPYVCETIATRLDDFTTIPRLFRASAVDESTVELSWIPPPKRCEISGYRVSYYTDPMNVMYMTVPSGDSNGAVVTGLMAETTYTFRLAVMTPEGTGNDIAMTTETTLPPINPCPEGWVVGYLGRCYRFGTSPMSYNDARQDCRSIEDGDLVVIETGMENEFLYNLTQGGMWWIGYNDIAIEGDFNWVDCDATTAFAETNWEMGQPDNVGGIQDCTIMTNSGRYSDWDCLEPITYLCEQSPKGYAPEDANPRSVSATATNPSTVVVTWVPESRYNCDVLGYRVIYPNPTPVVVDVPGADSSSLTITDLQGDTTYWISVGAYTYFEDLPYINDTTVTTPNPDDLCEEGWVPGYDFRCYKFGSEMLSWEDARLDCQSIPDGDLVVFETEAEWEFVSTLGAGASWWLGLFDRASEGEYRWVTCDALDTWATDNWAPGQPNDLQGNQDCVQMLGSGMWNDLECTSESLYVCEVTVKDYTVDDQSPDTLRGEATDPSTVELTWEPSAYNCEVLGYTIYIQEGINSMTQTVEGGDTTSTLVKNLEPSTVYVFDIAAFTTYDTLPAVGRTVRITMPSASSGECGPSSYSSASSAVVVISPIKASSPIIYSVTL